MTTPKIITFLGNFGVDFSSESHHAKSLEALGHTVHRLQEGRANAEIVYNHAIISDLFVWVHTHSWITPATDSYNMKYVLSQLKRGGIPSLSYHLDLWFGIERQKDLEGDSFYKQIEYFFTCDMQMADWFNSNTEVKGRYMPAGVFDKEVSMAKGDRKHDVIFVGSRGYHPEWSYRPELIDWLKATYGDRFRHYGGDGLGVVRGRELNQLYADTKVVVGDSLNIGFDYPYYWSDRVYETTGRGGFIIHPKVKGLDKEFDYGKEIVGYDFGDFDQLKGLIDFYIKHEKPREMIRQRGYKRTRDNHTYKHRWESILDEVFND